MCGPLLTQKPRSDWRRWAWMGSPRTARVGCVHNWRVMTVGGREVERPSSAARAILREAHSLTPTAQRSLRLHTPYVLAVSHCSARHRTGQQTRGAWPQFYLMCYNSMQAPIGKMVAAGRLGRLGHHAE